MVESLGELITPITMLRDATNTLDLTNSLNLKEYKGCRARNVWASAGWQNWNSDLVFHSAVYPVVFEGHGHSSTLI